MCVHTSGRATGALPIGSGRCVYWVHIRGSMSWWRVSQGYYRWMLDMSGFKHASIEYTIREPWRARKAIGATRHGCGEGPVTDCWCCCLR